MTMSYPHQTLNTKLLRNLVFPVGDFLFGQKMISRLKFLEAAQYWSPSQIEEQQTADFRKLIRVAYEEVPFYRQLFLEWGIRPEKNLTPADLSRMPVVTKDRLRAAYPQDVTRSTGQKTYEVSTSGSTGKNFHVMEDALTSGNHRAAFLLALEWAGWSIGEPQLQTGMTLKRSLDRRLKDWLLGCHYVSAYDLSDSHLDEILNTIEKYHLKHLWGYPGSLYLIAQHAQKRGWNQPLHSVVSWGDMLYPHYRAALEKTFQTRVTDTYGCSEGFQVSAQCEFGNYHIHALDTLVEFLDEDGQPVSPGQVGSIILTRLHPGPMPLIRYQVGDLGSPSALTSCPCGRNLPMMSSLFGRNTDIIQTPSGNRLIVHFFTGVLEHFTDVESFQVIQDELESITVLIVPTQPALPGLSQAIIKALKDRGAADLEIKVEFVDQIPLQKTGKNRFIISSLKASSGSSSQ